MNSNGRPTNRYSTRGQSVPRQPGRVQYNPYSGRGPVRQQKQSMDKFKSVAQFTFAVIVAAIPISFYLVQPGDIHNAVASSHTSEDIKQILNTLGGNIKDKASDVFGDGRTLRVKASEPVPRVKTDRDSNQRPDRTLQSDRLNQATTSQSDFQRQAQLQRRSEFQGDSELDSQADDQSQSKTDSQLSLQDQSEMQARSDFRDRSEQVDRAEFQSEPEFRGQPEERSEPDTDLQAVSAPEQNNRGEPEAEVQAVSAPEQNNRGEPEADVQDVSAPEQNNRGVLKSVSQQATEQETALQHAAKHTDPTYICPMHPDVVSKDPKAICPICGMDLVLLEAGGESGTVKLSPTVINTLGVRTAEVKKRTLFRKINSVGYVEIDDTRLRSVNLRVEGWIEKLHVTTEGDRVEKGQPLFELYSPKLVNAQEEYVQAMQHQNELVLKASHDRLLSLGVSEEQISLLKTQEDVKQHVVFYAPQKGVISKHKIREGQFVKPTEVLLEIVDLDSIWVIAEIFESQSDWVKKGQRAKASLPYLPGESIEGMVDYVYPSLDPKTRSLKVRLTFDNPGESIKPNMYADVEIYAKPKKKVLTIPREALITTGDENRVIISMGEGKFIPMKVKVGMRTDKGVEILNGLAEGDVVVTSSQFLIDSESSLKASLAKMAGGG